MQEIPETEAPCAAAKTPKHVKHLAAFEGILFLSRWLQLPLFIGLVVALVVFELKFAEHLINILSTLDSITRERAILVTLDLIDMVLIANLVVMVVISGYATFISRLHMEEYSNIPAGMMHGTPGQLKLRIATTILLISTIHLLHMYFDPAEVNEAEMYFMLIAQIVFILTAAAFVIFNKLEQGPQRNGGS